MAVFLKSATEGNQYQLNKWMKLNCNRDNCLKDLCFLPGESAWSDHMLPPNSFLSGFLIVGWQKPSPIPKSFYNLLLYHPQHRLFLLLDLRFFFFFSFFRILFTFFFLCWVFIAAQAFSLVVASRGYSLVVIRGLIMEASLVAEHRLQGTLASVAVACRLWSTGSIAVVHWLSYSACGIFPDQGSNPCLLHWQVDSLPIELPGKSLTWVFCQLHNQSVSIYCLEFRNLARTQNCKLGWGKKLYLDFQKPLTGNLHFLWL